MITDITTAVTDALYRGLFGLTVAQVNDALGLLQGTDEETRRDHMGVLALKALASAESAMTDSFKRLPRLQRLSLEQVKVFANGIGRIAAWDYTQRGIVGVALLTLDEAQS